MSINEKLVAIVAIGDLFMQGGAFLTQVNNISDVFTVLQQASDMSMNLGADEDEQETYAKLRAALVEAYIAMVHAIPELGQVQTTIKIFEQIFKYLCDLISQTQFRYSDNMTQMMIQLYVDLGQIVTSLFDQNQQNYGQMVRAFQENHQLFGAMKNASAAVDTQGDQMSLPEQVDSLEKKFKNYGQQN